MMDDLKVRILTTQAGIDDGKIRELRIKTLDLRKIDPQLNFLNKLEKKNSKIAVLERRVKKLEEERILLFNLICPACARKYEACSK